MAGAGVCESAGGGLTCTGMRSVCEAEAAITIMFIFAVYHATLAPVIFPTQSLCSFLSVPPFCILCLKFILNQIPQFILK